MRDQLAAQHIAESVAVSSANNSDGGHVTKTQMQEVMARVFSECQVLRDAGQKEYAHDEDNAFANFERLGKRLQLPREKVLLVYAIKHWDGVIAHVNGHTSQREDVRGRINDLIVYLCLLRGMIEEGK